MTCNRVMIMYQGRILAADTPENLQRNLVGNGQVVAEISAPPDQLQQCWTEIPEVEHFDISPAEGDYYRCALTPHNGMDLRPRVYDLARQHGWPLRELTRNRHTLEDIYIHVTRPSEEEEA